MDNPFRDAGVTDEELLAAINSPEISDAKIALAEKCRDYWRAIARPHARTFRYFNSIHVEVTDAVRVVADTPYAADLEFGTGGDSPTPEFAWRSQTEAAFADRED